VTIDVTAYCDESETPDAVFCIAGYSAPFAEWVALEEPWRRALEIAGRREFKMGACEGLAETQRHFISLITSHNLHAFATIIDLRAYNAVASAMKAKRYPGYAYAYYLAFQHELEMVALYPAMQKLATEERVRFIFDAHEQYGGKAETLYESVKRSEKLASVADRLGELSFEDSVLHVGVQAADALAHETMRHFRDVVYAATPAPERWQWRSLQGSMGFSVRHFNDQAISAFLRLVPDLSKLPTEGETVR
jgi:hypothetical protein